eukprot:6189085-Pleurochrysis_carterae.AAC.4
MIDDVSPATASPRPSCTAHQTWSTAVSHSSLGSIIVLVSVKTEICAEAPRKHPNLQRAAAPCHCHHHRRLLGVCECMQYCYDTALRITFPRYARHCKSAEGTATSTA